jgi:hypothetical protein
MKAQLSPHIQTIQFSSAGQAVVLAHHLALGSRVAPELAAWVDRLVGQATSWEIRLQARDVRGLLADPIDVLANVLKKSHPRELRGFGTLDAASAAALAAWCAGARVFVEMLDCVGRGVVSIPAAPLPATDVLPTTLTLTTHQRNALDSFLQVADDEVALLRSLLRLAQAPYAPLFSSSLAGGDLATCHAACAGLEAALAVGERWIGRSLPHRWDMLVYGRLLAAEVPLNLVLEGTMDRRRRQELARLLIELADLKRHV